MFYKIVCWIPVEPDEPGIYPTREEALRELKGIRFGFLELLPWRQELVIMFGLWKNWFFINTNYQYIKGSPPKNRIDKIY